ncbi:MAG: DUF2330 domain-containing protein [Myxococcaceae bacterium]
MNRSATALGAALLTVGVLAAPAAEACGCFAPPSPAEVVVQAGERILFAVENGKVTAHIQIQYAGEAKDFGWLLPLPNVPTLQVGTDELFVQLQATTNPTFLLTSRSKNCPRPISFGCASSARAVSAGVLNEPRDTPLVRQATVGPYAYAVLKADDKTAMFKWLADNRYFVPAGTEDAVGPYVRPGAYFLALKLLPGRSTGDLTPVILEYASELPMIPLILTSVGATPNMGVQVWLLGNARAIPRNYHHVVLNEALLDWQNQGKNYNDVVIRAVAQAPGKHGFVTEYAATSDVMRGRIAPPARFGTEADLAAVNDPGRFVAQLYQTGFTLQTNTDPTVVPLPVLPGAVKSVVLKMLPMPGPLKEGGLSEDDFLRDLGNYLSADYRAQHPAIFENYTFTFDPVALAHDLFTEYVKPMRDTEALFARWPKLTRLYTTLSPADMTSDPVFSFNPSLPDVPRLHEAVLEVDCSKNNGALIVTSQGSTRPGGSTVDLDAMAGLAAARIETLSEEGDPVVVTDNTEPIAEQFPRYGTTGGCSVVDPTLLGLLVLVAKLRRGVSAR